MNQRDMYRRRFAFPIFALAAIFAMGAFVRFLWNAILPSLVNVNPISYWQAVGLLVLCKILFGGLGGHRGGPPRWGNWGKEGAEGEGESRFSPSWRRKWMQMTDEERQKFKQEWRNRCIKPPKNT